jgi:N-acetylglutamate synthase-like GNAT family acetyltransferase
MYSIRPYQDSDLQTVQKWWIEQGLAPVWRALLPLESTYILEIDGEPALCACLYLMNSEDACMVENLVGNPKFKGTQRYEAVPVLFKHLENEAKRFGYRTLVLFTYEDKLKERYQDLGFIKTTENVTTFAKSI